MQTTIAGGWNGAAIFVALVIYRVGAEFVTSDLGVLVTLPVQLVVAVFGVLVAFVVGAIVGFVYGLIDALIIGCGGWLYRFSSASTAS
jgi:hypothetical protein